MARINRGMNYKHVILLEYAQRYKLKTFVETGTLAGDVIIAMSNSKQFDSMYTIEKLHDRYEYALKRLRGKPSVHCIEGSSLTELPKLLTTCSRPAMFFLDAHYAGRHGAPARDSTICPLVNELEAIAENHHSRDFILIDDVHYMTYRHQRGWPTLKEVEDKIHTLFPEHLVFVYWNLIRVIPSRDCLETEQNTA